MMSDRVKSLKQPRVFYFSTATASFERFGFYSLSYLLVLYVKNFFNFSDHDSFILFGVFNALVFLAPALGGYLGDNIIGIKRTLIVGLVLEALALLALALPTDKAFLVALALTVVGVGLFKVAPTDLLGRAYASNDARIDSGFTLYYMLMNIGAALAPITTGYVQRYFGWHMAFLCGFFAMLAAVITYFVLKDRATDVDSPPGKKPLSIKKWIIFLSGTLVSIGIVIFLLNYATISNIFFAVSTIFLLIYFVNEIRKGPRQEKMEICACLCLIIIGMIFFIMYFQLYMSITLFTDRCINHNFLGLNIPTSAFLGLNPIWVILFSPFLVMIYNNLERKKKDLKITAKFALGLLFTSLCFMFLYFSHFFHDANFTVSNLWLILAIGLFSFGELLISALGVAMVARIAPKRMYGVMMGAWYLIACSLASSVSGKVSDLASIPDSLTDKALILGIYAKAFLVIGLLGVGFAVIVFLISPYINRIGHLK
jgi:POT family proton-dependent oligopeptide transporter